MSRFRMLPSLLFVLLFATTSLLVQAQDLKPLPAEIEAEFETRLEAIEEDVLTLREIQARIESEEAELLREIMRKRADSLLTDLFDLTMDLARDVARQRDAGFDVASLEASLAADLEPYPDRAVLALERISRGIRFPGSDLEPAELVRLDQELLSSITMFDAVFRSLVTYVEIADVLGLDDSNVVDLLLERLPETAANRSAFLSVALDRVGVARAAADTLPDDQVLDAHARAAEARVRIASQSLQQSVRLMNAMGLDTRAYRQQILTATGEVTTDVLDVGILRGLAVEAYAKAIVFAREQGPPLVFRLFVFLLIVFVAYRLGRLVRRIVYGMLERGTLRMSHLLQQMIVASIGNIIFLIGVLIGLSQLGIALGPLLAGLGIVGFIVGFALQDTLSNFASGMMILVYRPFDVGDFVTAGGISGRVQMMSLVNTTFKTFDNQVVIVPNSEIWQSVITNMTAQKTRRVDLSFVIPYEEDIERAETIFRDILDNYDKILAEPVPNIRVQELGERGVTMIVRPWVKTEDYYDTFWDLTRLVKERFDAEGIRVPFPQRTVHMAPAEVPQS